MEFPLELKSSMLMYPAEDEDYIEDEEGVAEEYEPYDLQSVIVHEGSADGGHYYAFRYDHLTLVAVQACIIQLAFLRNCYCWQYEIIVY